MSTLSVRCAEARRRQAIREHMLNGIDYVEVGNDGRTLLVYFLGAAPTGLTPANVAIAGTHPGAALHVTAAEPVRQADRELDDVLRVTLARPGDGQTYTLRLVDAPAGTPTDRPLPGFDERFAAAEFRFDAGRPSQLDCAPPAREPPLAGAPIAIDYATKDYAGFRQLILDRMALTMPAWRERHVPDLGVTMIELLAYAGDQLSYYQDAVASEAYLGTARQRISVRRHARLIDYALHEGCNARAWVCVEADHPHSYPRKDIHFVTAANQTHTSTSGALPLHEETFEPLSLAPQQGEMLRFYPAHNQIALYTWGDDLCYLPRGATSATLCDGPAGSGQQLHLAAGDVLIFEELRSPFTGNPADADRSHRHVVRLTRATTGLDSVTHQPVVAIEWGAEDALPFDLQLSTIGAPPDCVKIEQISVARGNVVLVDHGRTMRDIALGSVPIGATSMCCAGPGELADELELPGRFNPCLRDAPLTFSQPVPTGAPAARLLRQDPRAALPSMTLEGRQAAPEGLSLTHWVPRPDLLASGPADTHCVAEIDNGGHARLRFGDGQLGRRPDAQTAFRATYRIGNGPAGNVGAEAITRIVVRNAQGHGLRARNPLPAQGGTPPESIEQARLLAPHAIHAVRERAVIAEDYAELALREFGTRVQRAAARLRWTGSGYVVWVAIDPLGGAEADPVLLREIQAWLEQHRTLGHDVVVTGARYVPLQIELSVDVLPHYERGHVLAALLDRFSARALPGGDTGMFHPNQLTFGQPIYLSRLVAAALAVPGVADVKVDTLERQGRGPHHELADGVLPIGPFEIARLDNDPGAPNHGQLRLRMRGGR